MEEILEYLQVFLLSILPISEVRGAIPYGIAVLKLKALPVFLISLFGNLLIGFFLLLILEKLFSFLSLKFKILKQFFDWLFERTRKKFSPYHQKWQNLGLCLFVALPLPFTGAWTGSLAAFLFGIKKKMALISISLGVLIASVIVLSLTLLGIEVEKFFGYKILLILIFAFWWICVVLKKMVKNKI
jgi:uncharacterized membrane protein